MHKTRFWIGLIALTVIVTLLFIALIKRADDTVVCAAQPLVGPPTDMFHKFNIREDQSCDWPVDFLSEGCRAASADALRKLGDRTRSVIRPTCAVIEVGSGNGKHMLCDFVAGEVVGFVPTCQTWLSFGIAGDYSFDTQLRARCPWCTGHLFDPSMTYPSRIQNGVFFYKLGLSSKNHDFPSHKGQTGDAGKDLGFAMQFRRGDNQRLADRKDWVLASLPTFFRIFVGDTRLAVLKMDCEGCEYEVAKAVAEEDPRLFARVDQVTLEVHVSRTWMRDVDDMFHLGMLFHMMQREGLQLQHASLDACGAQDEAAGCLPEFVASGMTCVRHAMCHNYLFARIHNL